MLFSVFENKKTAIAGGFGNLGRTVLLAREPALLHRRSGGMAKVKPGKKRRVVHENSVWVK
jgi:hypothetical protein